MLMGKCNNYCFYNLAEVDCVLIITCSMLLRLFKIEWKKNSICILVPECVSCARPVFHTPFVSGRPADCGGQY